MGMANEMQKLADDILASYKVRADELQQRLNDNNVMVKDVQEMLQGFRNDHQEIVASIKANAEELKENAKKLKADMAKDEQDRLMSYKEMMDGIKRTISTIQNEVVGIKISTENMIKDFSNAHKDMTAIMQEDFAGDKSQRAEWNDERMKTFDVMMHGIHDDMARINQEVEAIFKDVAKFLVDTNHMMKEFAKEHGDMSVELRADLQASLKERQDYTRSLLNDFSKRLAEISKENRLIADKLHNELDKSRKDLSDSDVQRMNGFNITMGVIQGRVNEIQSFVNTFLGDLKNDRGQASEIWEKLAEAKANIGKIFEQIAPPEKKVPVKKEKPAEVVKKEPVEEIKPALIVEKPIEEKTEENELSLEDKVLNYINKHPKGVKVSDMEKPLGETRMKIGFIAKQLLDDGKVNKVDNIYFPKLSK